MKILVTFLNTIYNPLLVFWEGKRIAKIQSAFLTAAFLISVAFAAVNNFSPSFLPAPLGKIHLLQAIEITFTLLLFFEMISLVFVIPNSIANSIGKQIEILSLVLLRSSFKEFSQYNFQLTIQSQLQSVYKMMSDGISAIIIFLILSFYYGIQQHKSITADGSDKEEFIMLKKIISFLVLIALFVLQLIDIAHMFESGSWRQSVDKFYMILIFADLLFMLAAFRYTLHFPDVFRYSAFVLVTVFIRLSLMAPVYYNGLLGIFSVLFALSIVYFHNIFTQGRQNYIKNKISN